MPDYRVRIEGVDFAATLYDTDDLSTIRGASQAYFYMPERIAARLRERPGWCVPDKFPRGASIGVFTVTTPDDITEAQVEAAVAEAITQPGSGEKVDTVRPHLSFTWAVVPKGDDYGADVYLLEARCRTRQWQRLTVDLPSIGGFGIPCHFDRKRPAVGILKVGTDEYPASCSVIRRHAYGRNERHRFYADALDWTLADLEERKFFVTQSLRDIVEPPLSELGETDRVRLPVALTSKLAVVYLDGNKFTAIREATVFGGMIGTDKEARHKQFDEFVRVKKRRELLSRVVKCLSRDRRHNWVYRDGECRLRFETLLWGGDEALFVLPAWAIMDVLPVLMEALEGWTWQSHRLSHAVGVVICNVKTPIAVARTLAENIADEVKNDAVIGTDLKNLENAVSIQVFESVEPPRADLGQLRLDLYGTKAPDVFALKGHGDLNKMLALIRRCQKDDDGLPRSQLYRLLAQIRAKKLLDAANTAAAQAFIDDAPESAVSQALSRSGGKLKAAMLRSPSLGYSPETPLLPLIRLAELWDYVDPFGAQPAAATP